MTRPVNLYSITRIREEGPFNLVEKHASQSEDRCRFPYHEIESLRILVDELTAGGVPMAELDGFHLGFHIPQIGKEFDLLKLTEGACLNIELKSQDVPPEQMRSQLMKNRYYLSHLGARLSLYTFVSKSRSCYKLSLTGELLPIGFGELLNAVRSHAAGEAGPIEDRFRASQYLVSPFTTPGKFIRGEYFLTQAQDQVKRSVLAAVEAAEEGAFFHITGNPGTGKTLLVYDLARELSASGRTLILYGGPLSGELDQIRREIGNLDIVSAETLEAEDLSLRPYAFLLADECHRMEEAVFDRLCQSVRTRGQVCIFSSDPEQVLTAAERDRDIAGRIRALPGCREFTLFERIRTNKELFSFIQCLKNLNHRPEEPTRYPNVDINYANTAGEAQDLLAYYRAAGYVFINCAAPAGGFRPYAEYEEDFDSHRVIGREFDRVVMLMDSSFRYDEEGLLQGIPQPDPEFLYPNLFYQGVTRAREKLALIVVDAPDLFRSICSILA